jgi:ATP-binding cassette subfamily B protein/subfamily B ATP-binding cassette protein MsbA
LQLSGLLRGYRVFLALGVACALAYTLLSLVPPLLLRRAVQLVLGAQVSGSRGDAGATIAFLAVGVMVVAILRGLARYGDAIISHIVAYRILDGLLKRVYAHLVALPHRFFADARSGELASRAVADVEAVEVFIAHAIAQAVQALLIPLAMLLVLLAINPRLALLTVAPLPVAVLMSVWFAPKFHAVWRRVRTQLGELGATFHEDIGGVPVIKAFARERERNTHLATHSERFRDEIIAANLRTLAPTSTIEVIAGAGAALVVWQGGMRGVAGTMSAADLVLFILYGAYIYQPLLQLAALGEGVHNAMAAGERVFELLATKSDIIDAPTAFAPTATHATVTFDHVVFGYSPDRLVLNGLDLVVGEGETVALVGPTGVGKTTTASLVPRFYDVQGGAVRVGDHDVRDVRLAWLREQIAMVLQDVFLFYGSVRENLLFGRPEATDADLRAAARAARADEFIEALPWGYDTMIGERGVRLSGGQKQRLSIARAILKDAPVLILDEPTSSVDVETEAMIQEALTRLARGRTTIVIAHRLSTIRTADRIAVLHQGVLEECGDHATLLALDGHYARLYRVQLLQQAWTLRDREGVGTH